MEQRRLVKVNASVVYAIEDCDNDALALIRAKEQANRAFKEPGWHIDSVHAEKTEEKTLGNMKPAENRPAVPVKEKTLEESMNTLDQIAAMEDDWDGYGANKFPDENILFFRFILRSLMRQPDSITPTASSSLVLQYNAPDGVVYYNLEIDKLECVCMPEGDAMRAEERTYPETEDPAVVINNDIADIYRF